MAAYDSSNTNTQIKASRDTVRIASEVVDFSSTTNAAADTFDVIGIPANTLVLAAGMDIISAGTGTGTVSVGDSIDPDQYVAATVLTSAGQKTALDGNFAYSSADAIRLTTATAAVNAKVRVWAVMISLDKGGNDSDSDTQSVTFSS